MAMKLVIYKSFILMCYHQELRNISDVIFFQLIVLPLWLVGFFLCAVGCFVALVLVWLLACSYQVFWLFH